MSEQPLADLIRDCYVERVKLLMRHEDVAQVITDYDINNAYQYIIAREETHVSWLQHSLLDLGSVIPPDPAPREVNPSRKGKDATLEVAAKDGADNGQFVERWRDRVEHVTNARQQGMLRVVLGEMLEHKRLFEQAAAGRTDIIGTHLPTDDRRGKVIDTRWVE